MLTHICLVGNKIRIKKKRKKSNYKNERTKGVKGKKKGTDGRGKKRGTKVFFSCFWRGVGVGFFPHFEDLLQDCLLVVCGEMKRKREFSIF